MAFLPAGCEEDAVDAAEGGEGHEDRDDESELAVQALGKGLEKDGNELKLKQVVLPHG